MVDIPKTSLKNTDPDFNDWAVTINNNDHRSDLIVSVDTIKGEIWRYQIDGDGHILPAGSDGKIPQELATGNIRINKKPPAAEAEPAPAPAPTPAAPAAAASTASTDTTKSSTTTAAPAAAPAAAAAASTDTKAATSSKS